MAALGSLLSSVSALLCDLIWVLPLSGREFLPVQKLGSNSEPLPCREGFSCPSRVLSCACPSVPPSPPDQGLSGLPPELSRQVTSSGVATTLKITGSWGQSHPAPHTAVKPHGTLGCVWKGYPGRLPVHEAAVEVQHYPMQTVLPSLLR